MPVQRMLTQKSGDRGINLRLVFEFAAVENYVCSGIELPSLGESRFDGGLDLFVAFVAHKRAFCPVAREARRYPFDRGVKPYDVTTSEHIVHIIVKTGRSAATRYDDIFEFACLPEHRRLYSAELIFSLFGEYLVDSLVETLLYILVKIYEFAVYPAGQCSAESGFATCHVSYYEHKQLFIIE